MEICSNGKILNLKTPVVMGVINANKDSFYTNSRAQGIQEIVEVAGKMIEQGASILDIGGVSTRPGSVAPSVAEELERVIPAITAVGKNFPEVFLSVDTYRGRVVREAVDAGVDIINDVSAGSLDKDMLRAVAHAKLPYVLMHMAGTPTSMQHDPKYDNVTLELLIWLKNKLYALNEMGIEELIIDPGFGFGKTISHNYTLLRELASFSILGYPILSGISRKSMLYKLLDVTPEEALNATTVANTLSLMNGVSILRVHDVKPAFEAIKVFEAYKSA